MSAGRTALHTRPHPIRRITFNRDVQEAVMIALVAIGAIAVMAVWFGDTPGSALHSLGDKVTALGRVTGLLGTYLVLVQVVLMARLPWLERFVGGDRLATWHRKNGAYAISLLVAHAVFIIIGYAFADRVSLGYETGSLIRHYPDVLAGTIGLGLLVAVGVISIRQARRRLRYETWYFLHLYTYIAIALSFSHQLATGNDFINSPMNRILWIALYLVTFGLLAGYRIVSPIRKTLRHDIRVSNIHPEGRNAVSVYMTGRDLDALDARAGQFFRWRFLTPTGWWHSHPFSLSAAPNDDYMRITAKRAGEHSSDLVKLQPGTRVLIEGPYGAMTAERRVRRKVLLVAGGIGIAPLYALLEELDADPGDLTLLYRVRFEKDLVLREEIEQLAAEKGVEVFYILGARDANARALGPKQLAELVPDVARRDVYLCGPDGMMEDVMASLRRLGVRRTQIHNERFEF